MNKFLTEKVSLEEALTFDDVLLLPGMSEVVPTKVNVQTKLTKRIHLHAPDFLDHDSGGRPTDNAGFREGIVRLFDGPLAPVPCASQTAYVPCEDCADEATCGVRIAMKEVRDATARILDHTSLAQVRQRQLAAGRRRARG